MVEGIDNAVRKRKNRTVNETLKGYIADNRLTYAIETYGCQMNVHESEKMAGVLEALGYSPSASKHEADFIIYNTCCIREHAEARLYGNIGALKDYKLGHKNAVIAVCGCMMQQPEAAQKLLKRFPFVDLVFGTNSIHHLGPLLNDVLLLGQRAYCVDEDISIVEDLPVRRDGVASAFVNIIYGCNNFCTYCVVPYVRGRERSRRAEDIINEIKTLCSDGVSEITLLGQNVNSYGNGLEDAISFPQLLQRIDQQTNIRRIRFMTSHPKDMTDELIECFGRLPSLCEHVHLPVQSGSDRILNSMNRGYTRAHYLELIQKLRDRVPDISVTTDLIVGFPGETDDDFTQTLSLVTEVGFDAAYTFAYSKRKLTKAADMPGQIDKSVKSKRLSKLNALVTETMQNRNRAYQGRIVEVLVDKVSKRGSGDVVGRTRTAKTVIVNGVGDDVGRFINVRIQDILTHTMRGARTDKSL